MSVPRAPLKRIVVAGDGQLGSLAALAIKQALPFAEVIIIGTPFDNGALADRSPTALPFTNRFHDRLGLQEAVLLLRAGGCHRLVLRYIGWGGQDSAGTLQHGAMPYGLSNDASLKTRFAQEWGGGSRSGTEGQSNAQFAGSVAEVLSGRGRFAILPAEPPTPLREIDYGLRWNPTAYRDVIIEMASAAGVRHVSGEISGTVPDGQGGLSALTIDGTGAIEADFFVDCTGPSAMLLSGTAPIKRDDWREYLPIRQLAFAQPVKPVLSLEDRVSLPQYGWLNELAGRDALQLMLALPDGVSDQQIIEMLGQPPADSVSLNPGAVREPWVGNVAALGDATAQFEPLGFLNLDLAHRQLELLLEMLPGQVIDPRERAEYNRRAGLMAAGVRDVLGLHYAAPAAVKRFGARKQSAHLERLLDQSSRRGRIPFAEELPFANQELSALLAALGIGGGLTPLASAEGSGAAHQSRSAFEAKAQAALHAAPPYGEWLGRFLQSNQPR
ncbi:tryptophan 7-halogenase [Erythrobacter insulae]|uniref:Tryptophan 7-halogenase n=1 Tax=Erythrobacter insulae TaxID=2584124 RepID=A0A547PA17_9SPHN|nr:tryptophan 7-halogenase [Erythrobacter insulae]TRD10991.1 tryptophan 7-halogenase [Erythrobacter insulae]